MKDFTLRVGCHFGLTSAVLANLALIVGITAAGGSKKVVTAALLVLSLAEFFSDSLGIHLSRQLPRKSSAKRAWIETLMALVCKVIFVASFLAPMAILSQEVAARVSVFWGLILLFVFSCDLAKKKKIKPWGIIAVHLLAVLVVIVVSDMLGFFLSQLID